MAETFDPYYTWLGIPPADQPPHHYRLLGVNPFEPNADAIANAADRQMAHVKAQATGQNALVTQRILTELTQAKVCLLHPQKKATYDRQLKRTLAGLATPDSTPAAAHEKDSARRASHDSPTAPDADRPGMARGATPANASAGAKSSSPASAKSKKKPPPLPAPLRIGLQLFMSALTLLIAYLVLGRLSPQLDVLHWFGSPPPADAPVQTAEHAASATSGANKTPPAPPMRPLDPPRPSENKSDNKKEVPLANGEPKAVPNVPPVVSPPDPPPKILPPPTPAKLPIPAEESRRAAEGTLAEKIGNANAKDLLALAAAAESPAERYVLLSSARESAARAGDLDVALRAVQEFVERFEVPPWEARVETLLQFQPGGMPPEACGKLAEQALKSAGEAGAEQQWDLAERCAILALTAGRRANQTDLVRQATLKLVECRKGKEK